jgi:methionine synthase II (cobalamin-independent)
VAAGRVKRSGPRLLTTHAGSLPRPSGLTALHARASQGEAIDPDELARAAEEATRKCVTQQLACGIDVEHPELVADRIELAARAVGDPQRVLAGTDCGFDTSEPGQVAEDVVWEKLQVLRAGADLAAARLL